MLLYAYIYFCRVFLFSSKKIWFLSFSFLFLIIKLQVSNFRNRISTNQKSELVIRNCQWNCMFFSTYYKHFYLISCFHDQRSYFYSITSLCLINHKTAMRKMWEEYFQWNYLPKKKELDKIVLHKRLFASIKEHFNNTKGQVVVESPLIGSNLW